MRVRLNLEKAIELCCEKQGFCNNTEKLPVEQCYNRVAAADIKALYDTPPFNCSRMDGYVLCGPDADRLRKMDRQQVMTLKITQTIPAGTPCDNNILAGQTLRVMTGAMLPYNAGAVIKQEDVTRISNEYIHLFGNHTDKTNIQNRGSIIKAGQVLSRHGEILDVEQLEQIASAGIDKLPVYRLPAIYIMNTGSELTLAGTPLKRGKIYNSNRAMFSTLLAKQNCKVINAICPLEDRLAVICDQINNGLKSADMIIVTGGTAEGDYDLVPRALETIEAERLFGGLDFIPGMRVSGAVKEGRLIFNFPGNPGAGEILFTVLVWPVLNKLKGINNYLNNWFKVRLGESIPRNNKKRIMLKGELYEKNGALLARPKSGNSFQRLANIIMDITPETETEGSLIRAMLN